MPGLEQRSRYEKLTTVSGLNLLNGLSQCNVLGVFRLIRRSISGWLVGNRVSLYSSSIILSTDTHLGLKKLGENVEFPLEYKPLLAEVGFKNVTERKYAG